MAREIRRRGEVPREGPTEEPVEPGGMIGESREMGPGGSGLDQPGRPPKMRIEMHRHGKAPEAGEER